MLQYYIKLSWLSIKRTPMLTTLMVLAISLGIGVSMTVLTVNYLMGKDPIPSKSEQLYHVQLFSYGKGHSNQHSSDLFPLQLTYQDVMNIHQSNIPSRKTRSLSTGFSIIPNNAEFTPFMESARAIDSDFFAMFNIPFIYGNTWDKSVDSSPKNVIVIGKELNNKLFKGENSIGREINLNTINYTIVGVIDNWQPTPRFYDLNNGSFNQSEFIFVPFSLLPIHEYPSWGNNNGWKDEDINSYQDKLRSETQWNQYWVELNTQEQVNQYKEWLTGYIEEQKKVGRFENERAAASLKNVKQWLTYNYVVSDDSSILVSVSFMFLTVCMLNTIGLLLAKFLRRAPEVGVRRALGASRKEVFIQHLVDVSLIGLTGGLLGLLLGQLGLLSVKELYPEYHQLVYMDTTLIVVAILLSLGSSLIAGIYPAWKICQTNPSLYLKTQ
ncbi:ABC transporter permease [Aliikangiella sp. IMCC44359]|uniref:ABC transporter permease n=1 Tax=Aliikangiella sp. IMCC44359 TaxID=3459125 RepID=UPI00403B1791